MVDDPLPNLYEPPDDRVYRRLDAHAPERRIPNHVERIARMTCDEKPSLIGREPMAARFVPSECVLSFYPVLNLSPTIVDRDYLLCFKIRVGQGPGAILLHSPFGAGKS